MSVRNKFDLFDENGSGTSPEWFVVRSNGPVGAEEKETKWESYG